MAQYDEIVKHLMDRFSDEFARLAFNTSNHALNETARWDEYGSMVGKMR